MTSIRDPLPLRGEEEQPARPVRRRGIAALSWASNLDRTLTWGTEPVERDEILREREADRFEHLTDPEASMASVVTRSIMSSLADIWYRFVGTETSALPLAIVFALVGIGALADAFTRGITPTLLGLNVVTGIGYLAMAAAGLRQPLKLQRVWLLPGLVLASFGTIAGAIVLPPTAEAGLFGWVAKVALAGVGVGLAVVAVTLIRPQFDRAWIIRGGRVIWGSALFMAVGAVGWTVADAPIYSSRWSSLMVAFACVVGAAVIARLRNIEVA